MAFQTQILGAVICAFGLILPQVSAMEHAWGPVSHHHQQHYDYYDWNPQQYLPYADVRYSTGWEGHTRAGMSPNHIHYHFRWSPQRKPPKSSSEDWKVAQSVYDFTVNDIQGNPVSLSKYKGHVLLIVNVASKCGLTTTNYRELVELHERYHDSKGLRILAFPCNQFGGQEPGNNDDIVCFARAKNAHFDFFEKVNVNGEDAHPLWKYLKKEQKGTFGDAIKWNFTKFIVDKNGRVVERHAPTTDPLKLISSLEKYF